MASTHLIVARSGAIIQLVPFDRQAWHAGASRWSERRLEGLNKFSIGIMYSNWGDLKKDTDGRYASWNGQAVAAENVFAARKGGQETYWEKYSAAQIEVSRGIVRAFRAVKSDIGLLGHSDISPGRKTDPGPAFPIQMLRDLR
jgi:N-acetylmuramoyl-L-alanine amidase